MQLVITTVRFRSVYLLTLECFSLFQLNGAFPLACSCQKWYVKVHVRDKKMAFNRCLQNDHRNSSRALPRRRALFRIASLHTVYFCDLFSRLSVGGEKMRAWYRHAFNYLKFLSFVMSSIVDRNVHYVLAV